MKRYCTFLKTPGLEPHYQMQYSIIIRTFVRVGFTSLQRSSLHIQPSRLGLQNTTTSSLQRGKTPPNECPVNDTKQSDCKALVILELWGMWSTPSLPSLPGQLWIGVVVPDRVLSMGQVELLDIETKGKQMINSKLNCLK